MSDQICEWCKGPGDLAEVYDAAGTRFLLCEDRRDAVAAFVREKYPSACADGNDARAYNLAQSITGGA